MDATFVAAIAAVPNIATNAAASPNSLIFTMISNRLGDGPSAHRRNVNA